MTSMKLHTRHALLLLSLWLGQTLGQQSLAPDDVAAATAPADHLDICLAPSSTDCPAAFLPAQCPASDRLAGGAAVDTAGSTTSPDPAARPADAEPSPSYRDEPMSPDPVLRPVVDDQPPATDGADEPIHTIISFEDWKDLMRRRAGHAPADETRAATDPGDEGEAIPDLGSPDQQQQQPSPQPPADGHDTPDREMDRAGDGAVPADAPLYDDGKTQYYRSRDAGKTCKERFSYSSFDAGATVLKASAGAKNVKAILVENKDSYMLLECADNSKHVTIELSDDILVDTVVLANFEFFSSMIRHFRVAVSDRYPVKEEKWKEVGTFEARNSRDIQPFLVENPQIWAKYVRIEFLSHYGNEYYCPLSLVRVHGTRMLESWQDTEGRAEEDEERSAIEAGELADLDNARVEEESAAAGRPPHGGETASVSALLHLQTPNHLLPGVLLGIDSSADRAICPAPDYNASIHHPATAHVSPHPPPTGSTASDCLSCPQDNGTAVGSDPASPPAPPAPPPRTAHHTPPVSAQPGDGSASAPLADGGEDEAGQEDGSRQDDDTTTAPATGAPAPATTRSPPPPVATATSSVSRGAQNVSGTAVLPKSKSTATAGPAPASPTVQESFFKSITKRLQLLESNVTLTLKYLESQSKHVNAALQQAERRHASKIEGFLNVFNQTMLAELHLLREQYDFLWRLTVDSLEQQRGQSQRDIVAIGSRLNVLADEVVFQKRMAIAQAALLLSCLFLVIFSRGMSVPVPQFAFAPTPESWEERQARDRARGRAQNAARSRSEPAGMGAAARTVHVVSPPLAAVPTPPNGMPSPCPSLDDADSDGDL